MNMLSFPRTINNCNKALHHGELPISFVIRLISSYQTTALFTTPVAATYTHSGVRSVCLRKGSVSDGATIAPVGLVTTYRTRIFLRDTSGERVEKALTRTSCIVTTHSTGKKQQLGSIHGRPYETVISRCAWRKCVQDMATRCGVTVVEPWEGSNQSLYIKLPHRYSVTKMVIGFNPTWALVQEIVCSTFSLGLILTDVMYI
jgi:hypothetical protein